MRSGKSYYGAIALAAALKAGQRVAVATFDENGRLRLDHFVGVPGFDDGCQIVENPTDTRVSRNSD